MTTYWHNKTKVIVLAILIILWGAICIQKATGGTYTDSIHGGGWGHSDGVDRSTIDDKYSNYADGNCAHCHEAHASLGGSEPAPVDGGPAKRLGFSEEEDLCEECHDGNPVLKDILTQAGKTHRHPIHDTSGVHTLSKLEYGQDGAPFRGANRHAECCDCHNPHTIGGIDTNTPVVHPAWRDSNANRISDGNKIYDSTFGSAALQGVWGVEPNSYPSWQSPASYTETLPANGYPRYAEKEYQICLKCHSTYGEIGNDTSSGTVTTCQAKEFSPGNKSGHPVMVTSNNRTGSYNRRSLRNTQMRAPWKANVGNTTMYCSDCHGNNHEGADDPVGPHGSGAKHMLASFVGPAHHLWPKNADGQYWRMHDVVDDINDWDTKLFCTACHVIKDSDGWLVGDWHPNLPTFFEHHGTCIDCHAWVPHGLNRSRLIVYKFDPSPYVNLDWVPKMMGFKKAADGNYVAKDCYTSNASCNQGHSTNDYGYDF